VTPGSTFARPRPRTGAPREVGPLWARWNRGLQRRYTLGIEEELMLLQPDSCSLAQASDQVVAQISDELSFHALPETHAAVIELRTGIHTHVDGGLAELATLRRRLFDELGALGLSVAAAGTHPLAAGEETSVSSAARYQLLGDSLRSLARREPTMALHVHVGVPDPEDAIRVLNGLRSSVPMLIALSANSPYLRGSDGGFDSMRTVVFQAFPRTGAPRAFDTYADYVGAIDPVIRAGAVPDSSFFWWDVRPQPSLGTVEVRVMDAQSTISDVAPLVALIQSLARLQLESDDDGSWRARPSAEVLAENRFLAARDGMAARLIDPVSGRLTPVAEMVETLLDACRPHAVKLGCAADLERVRVLAAANGAARQRAFTAGGGGLNGLVPDLVTRFLAPDRHALREPCHGLLTDHHTTERSG
jgi:carboxylate-amine ligase